MKQPLSQVISLDAPIEGWDAYNSIDNMPPTAAIVLDNLIPNAGTVDTRQGVIEYYDLGTGVPCETVASLNSANESKLVAASGGGIWDITDTSPDVSAQAVEELAPPGTFLNNRWQHRNFRTAGEAGILIMCNGVDNVQIYAPQYAAPDPNRFKDAVFNDGEDPPVALPGTFIGVESFKGRCYYWNDNDDSFWYTNAGSYQGEINEYPLGTFVQRGGKLVMVTTWTQQDSGDGRDDFIVFVFSTGEILVYQGDDPGGVGFFEFVGRYYTAEPMSIRGRDKYGSDIIIMTKDGYVGLSSIIQQGRTSDVQQFSKLIHNAIVKETALRADFYGWDCSLFPKKGLMIFNVPLSDTSFEQHVLNTVTQRWCRFRDINVNCFNVHNERLFGGTSDGRVLAILEGTSDEGEPINFTSLYAFNYLGDPGKHKHMTAAQVLTTHSAPEFIQLSGYADFDVPVITPLQLPAQSNVAAWSINPATPPQAVGSEWDTDFWGRGGVPFTYKGWQNVSAFGYSVALLVRFAKLNEGVSWRSTTLRFHGAGSQ